MRKTILIFSSILLMASMTTVKANNPDIAETVQISMDELQPYLDTFSKIIDIPAGYQFYSVRKVEVDNTPAYLFRFEKSENKDLMGEHFSFVISEEDKRILGFTNMDKKYSNLKMLSKGETEKIAKDFLSKIDGILVNDLKNLWMDRHDEEVLVNGQKMVLAGMKYKCYRASNNDYAWVIVGYDGSVITFERDIKWNNSEHRRITEKWLHDNWVSEMQ